MMVSQTKILSIFVAVLNTQKHRNIYMEKGKSGWIF